MFWKQLRLLLWKNFLIRRRQKIWAFLEAVWPLTLFLILVWVRTRDLSDKYSECHYSPKALPSAGFLPFVQSYFCTIRNDCHEEPFGDDSIGKVNDADTSLLTKFADIFETILGNGRAPKDIKRTLDLLAALVKFTIHHKRIKEKQAPNSATEPNGTAAPLFGPFANVEMYLKVHDFLDSLKQPTFTNIRQLIDNLMPEHVNDATSDANMEFLMKFSCGGIQTGVRDMFPQRRKIDKIRERYQGETAAEPKNTVDEVFNATLPEESDTPTDYMSHLHNASGIFCKHFIISTHLELKCARFLRKFHIPNQFLVQIFAMLRGFIVITPGNPVTVKIREKMETWLQGFNVVKDTILDVFDNAEVYQDALAKSELAEAYWIWLREFPKYENVLKPLEPFFVDSKNSTAALPKLKKNIRPIAGFLECFLTTDRFRYAPNETELEKRALCLLESNKFFTGIVFENMTSETEELPLLTSYKLRMANYLAESSGQILDRLVGPIPRSRAFIDNKYMYYGFTFLQDVIDRAIIEIQTNGTYDTGVYTQQFPTPCYQTDAFNKAVERLMPLIMTMAWVCSAALIIKNIVYEKEKRLKEFMKVMGLGNFVHWVAWFIQSLTMIILSIFLFVIIAKYGNVIKQSDPTIIFLFVLLFTIATIAQCFLISTFFSKANVAAACGAIIYYVLYLPYPAMLAFGRTKYSNQILSCFLAQVSFGWGCAYIAAWETAGVGLQWNNIHKSPYADKFAFSTSIIMLVADTFIYLILTWYIEAVYPGQYGIPKPLYFFVLKSYWCGGATDKQLPVSAENEPDVKPHIEAEPKQLTLGVAVRQLRKVYSNGKTALSGLSLNFYESQITSFLGHNGAGKTTTLSIITGLFPPSDGTVFVYGKDVRAQTDDIRKSLGMCPQHNILFDMLTVQEQLEFYAGLKGVPSKEIRKHVEDMIDELGLKAKASEEAKNLSGGTQRRLAVAVAFIGGSKTVILDEPTAGVDPSARRRIWDLLLRKKEGRTIILSTHHMDEADVLGDRIAIISGGRLKCCGSSLFLKRCLGSGYYLTMARKLLSSPDPSVPNNAKAVSVAPTATPETTPVSTPSSSATALKRMPIQLHDIEPLDEVITVEEISNFVSTTLPGAELTEAVGRELTYRLPCDDPRLLKNLFARLEANMKKLEISSYGVSETKLEEVFLKVIGAEEKDEAPSPNWFRRNFARVKNAVQILMPKKKKRQGPIDDVNLMESSDDEADVKTQSGLLTSTQVDRRRGFADVAYRQIHALLIKRMINFSRNLKGAFCEIILPVLVVALTLYALGLRAQPGQPGNQGALPLLPWLYGPPNYIFFNIDNPAPDVNAAGRKYLDSLLDAPGVGIRCMPNEPFEEDIPCEPVNVTIYKDSSSTTLSHFTETSPEPKAVCFCDSRSRYQCPDDSYQPPPPEWVTNTTDTLVNVTGLNISEYLLMTERQFRRQRYAGYSLGELNSAAVMDMNWSIVDQNMIVFPRVFDDFSSEVKIDWYSNRKIPYSLIDFENSTFVARLNATQRLKVFLSGMETRSNVKIWYNNQGWAAIPTYVNVFNTAVLRALLPSAANRSLYGILVYNHPMNYSSSSQAQQLAFGYNLGILLFEAVMVILAFSVIPASFVLFIIEENVSHAKHLQFITGVKPWLYWVSNFFWDMANFMIPLVGCMLVFWIFDEKAYVGWIRTAGATFLLFFAYGFAIIPIMYPFTFLFRIPSLAFIILTIGNAFFGWVATTTTATLEALGQDDKELLKINEWCMDIFLMFPQYCLGRGLLDLKLAYFLYTGESYAYGSIAPPDPFKWLLIGRNIFWLFVEGVIGFALVLAIEYRRSIFKIFRHRHLSTGGDEIEDEDVRNERLRIASDNTRDVYVLKIDNLAKVYRKRGYCGRKASIVKAVNGVSVGVRPGECFGLLGVNGAGKTTTFKMLTGKTSVTSGDAVVNGHSILTELQSVCQDIGYCPQFDALHNLLTGREQLTFYARLRGVKAELIRKVVSWSIKHLGLQQHADRTTDTYSGGNKRKLSTAIALIGNPAVILLDEPTTGMDPKARRFLWNRITEIVRDGRRSVVLTSHSMEECEALCNRIGIMVNGKFRCLGSVQHLKTRFGRGYALTLKIGGAKPNTERAIEFIRGRFPGVVLKEHHLSQLQFQLPPATKSLSAVFDCMIDAMSELNVEDYSLSQTTLEQVFLAFAQEQGDAASEENEKKNG